MNKVNTYMECIAPDAEGISRWEVGAFQTEVSTGEVKPMISSRDSVKGASVSIADLDWPLIHRSVPNNYPLLLRDTTAPMFAEWLKDKAPFCELVVLGGRSEFPDEGGVLELSLANSYLDALRGVAPEGSPIHAVVRVKRYGVHLVEVKVECREVQAESACAELVLRIGGHWPEAVRRLRDQIDEEVQRNWGELDRELTLLLVGDEGSDTLGREVRDWLNSHAIGIRWVIENLGRTIEVRLWGEEGAIWRTACGMAERCPALAPEVAAKLVERMQRDLEERLSRDARRYLRDWLDEHSGESSETQDVGRRRAGRPGLDREELIYRLAKAQEGEEIKREDPSMTWKEIAREICWRPGSTRAGIKLLEDARHRLRRLQEDDPENLLEEVTLFRGKERREI